jgi:hypothetical protein
MKASHHGESNLGAFEIGHPAMRGNEVNANSAARLQHQKPNNNWHLRLGKRAG